MLPLRLPLLLLLRRSCGEARRSGSGCSGAPTAPAAGEKVNCPMPGNILDVRVNVGDEVKEGDILMILEAMKMENEILAPCAGKVATVAVAKGATVNSGDLLVVIG